MASETEQSSRLRAKIAKRTVKAQVEISCAKLRLKHENNPISIPCMGELPRDGDFLDPTKYSAPNFDKFDFDKIDESPLSYKDHHGVHFNVGVIGGGMSGLYASLILQGLGIGHEVIEASQRVGGRVWSHHFSEKDGDYYEVGAMLFPDIPIMARTARLLEYLDIKKDTTENPQQESLIPFLFRGPNNPRFYNNIFNQNSNQWVAQKKDDKEDIFNMSVENGGIVPGNFIRKGAHNVMSDVFDLWKKRLITHFDETWAELMMLDKKATSLRAYMIDKYQREGYDPAEIYYVTNWCEKMDGGTTHYDAAFTSWLMLSLAFEYPAIPGLSFDPKPILDRPRGNVWWTLNGGMGTIPKRLVNKLRQKPLYQHRVTGISHVKTGAKESMVVTISQHQGPGREPKVIKKEYSHVISTTTTPCLYSMDLRDAGLNYAQREGIRVLHYDNAVKVGIKFSKRWWAEERGITRGGSGNTDRPTRVIVYPSHALNTPPGESGVLIACYNYGQDATRLGGLSRDSKKKYSEAIFDAVMTDLAILHRYPEEELRKLVIDYHVHNWSMDELTKGHFTLLGPGQFSTFFGQLQRPAAFGHLFLAGEATSINHGWIVASLNSVYRAIHQMLLCELFYVVDNSEKCRYLCSLISHLVRDWGSHEYELESEYDTDPKGTAGWQVFLGIIGGDL